MLLWELTFEKVPYEGMEIDTIIDFVINGNREEIRFDLASPEIANIQKGLEKIIREGKSSLYKILFYSILYLNVFL